jgi:hypothetical protein
VSGWRRRARVRPHARGGIDELSTGGILLSCRVVDTLKATCPMCRSCETVRISTTLLSELHFCLACGKSFALKRPAIRRDDVERT